MSFRSERVELKSLVIIEELSIFPLIYVKLCFMYFEVLLLYEYPMLVIPF